MIQPIDSYREFLRLWTPKNPKPDVWVAPQDNRYFTPSLSCITRISCCQFQCWQWLRERSNLGVQILAPEELIQD